MSLTPTLRSYAQTVTLKPLRLLSQNVGLSQEFDHLAGEAVREEMSLSSSETLKASYIRCFNQAEIDGIQTSQISRVVLGRLNDIKRKMIKAKDPEATESECLINERWYFEVASAAGVTDPGWARNRKPDEEPHLGNSSTETEQGTPLSGHRTLGSSTVENQAMIDLLNTHIFHLKTMRNHLHGRPFVSKLPPELIETLGANMAAWGQNCEDYMNFKQTIPTESQVIFLKMYNIASGINDAFSMYFDEVKRIHVMGRARTKKTNSVLTNKEMKKITGRAISKLTEALEPADENDAWLNGFYGQRCKECYSYRTKIRPEEPTTLRCLKCGFISKRWSFVTCTVCGVFRSKEEFMDGKCPTEGCNDDIREVIAPD